MPAPDITNFFFFFFFNMSLIGPGMAKINSNELITVPAAYKEGSCRQAPSAHLPAGKTTTLENIKHHFFFFFLCKHLSASPFRGPQHRLCLAFKSSECSQNLPQQFVTRFTARAGQNSRLPTCWLPGPQPRREDEAGCLPLCLPAL